MAPIAYIGTTAYDMGDVVQAAQYHKDINDLLQDQHNLIQTLQAAPGLNQQNFTQLINALTPAARRTTGVTNPILTNYNGAGNVDYEEEIPEPGIEDIAKFPIPEPFTGKNEDAIPFIDRLQSYFKAKPKAFRFTRARILLTVSLLGHKETKTWAQQVRRAIANSKPADPLPHYFDSWEDFVNEFMSRHGIDDIKQHNFRLMVSYKQWPEQSCKSFTDQFGEYRRQSGTLKDQAFQYLLQNTSNVYRTTLLMRENPPTRYDDWVDALDKMQKAADRARGYQTQGVRQHPFHKAPAHKNTVYSRFQPSSVQGAGPMDLSAVTHAQRRGTKGKGPQKNSSKSPLKKPAHPRLAPHPDGRLKPSSPSPRTTPKQPVASGSQGRTFLCYKCNQPGHFARDCPVTLRNLDRHHIQAMESALTLIYKDMGLENEAEEEDDDEALLDPLTSMVLEEAAEEEEEETDLIDFGAELDEEDENGESVQSF